MESFASLTTKTQAILSHPTWDVMTIVALVGIGFFYGIAAGKRRIAITILYTYVAYAITSVLPFERLSAFANFPQEVFIKAGIFLILFFVLPLLLGAKQRIRFANAGAWWQIFILSFLQAGLLLHILITFLPGEYTALLAPVTKNLLTTPGFHLLWFIGPLVALIVLRRLESRNEY